jgi:hypothetical protein
MTTYEAMIVEDMKKYHKRSILAQKTFFLINIIVQKQKKAFCS